MKKAIQEFHQWVKSHPYKACLFSALMGILATWLGTRPYLTPWDAVLPFALLSTLAWVMLFDFQKRAVTVLLAICFLVQPFESRAQSPKEPAGGGAIIAIVVVVVGGVIVFRVVRFCQRAFPRNPCTNNPPAVVFGSQHSYALATSCSAIGGCYVAPSSLLGDSPASTVFELTGEMVEADEGGLAFKMQGSKKLEATAAVDLMEFQHELQEWGVHFGSAGETFYGIDGQPCGSDLVPITVSLNGANSSVDASDPELGHQAVTFERSADLFHWEPILTMTVSVGQKVSFSDATDGAQMFYRSRPAGD